MVLKVVWHINDLNYPSHQLVWCLGWLEIRREKGSVLDTTFSFISSSSCVSSLVWRRVESRNSFLILAGLNSWPPRGSLRRSYSLQAMMMRRENAVKYRNIYNKKDISTSLMLLRRNKFFPHLLRLQILNRMDLRWTVTTWSDSESTENEEEVHSQV